jgi:RND family efflux transporter MFP subunit
VAIWETFLSQIATFYCVYFVILRSQTKHFINETLSNSMNLNSLAISAMILLACAGCSGNDSAEEQTIHSVLVVQPTRLGDTTAKNYSGVVTESKSISLGFKTAGQILKTLVKDGQYVKQGQLLAVLDDVDYQLAAKEAKIQYDQMASEQKRLDYLYQSNNLSENDYEKSRAGLERLKINLQNCNNRLKYCRLYAPISGYVVKLNFERSEMVDAGTPVVELMDNSSLEVNVDLPAEAYSKREDFICYTITTADGEVCKSKLLSITPKADNNQLYSMRLSIPAEAKSKLTPGMNVQVVIERNSGSKVEAETTSYSLPIRSVFYDNDRKPCVWVIGADSTVTATPVTVGDLVGKSNVTITSGLSGKETIVRAGVNSLQPGEKVKIIDESNQTNVGRLL